MRSTRTPRDAHFQHDERARNAKRRSATPHNSARTPRRHAPTQLSVEKMRQRQRELSPLGALSELLLDLQVTDIVVNPDGSVWVDRGEGMQRTHLPAFSAQQTRDMAVRMAAQCGVRLDNASPYADGVLTVESGQGTSQAVRFHAMLSPPAYQGSCISLRVLSTARGDLDTLAALDMITPELLHALRVLVAARANILISGGTGTGKTTLLAALLAEISPQERIIIVEDTPELIINTHPHTLALTARRDNAEGKGAISMTALLKQCLRMRPDRIVVGEIRGVEIADLLVALNTGHAGSAGTVHANSPQAIPGRLEALGALAGLSARSLSLQVVDGVDVIIHLARTAQGRAITHLARPYMRGTESSHTHGAEARLECEILWDHRASAAQNSHSLNAFLSHFTVGTQGGGA